MHNLEFEGQKTVLTGTGKWSGRHSGGKLNRFDTDTSEHLRKRLKSDFRLAIISLFGLCGVLAITPFAIYRLLTGNLVVGLVDTAIVTVFAGIMLFAWRTGRSGLAGNLSCGMGTAAAMFVTVFLGIDHSWVFAVLAANFLLAERRFATAASAILIMVIAAQPLLFGSVMERMTFIAVALLISLFALVFASRVDSQHQKLSELAAHDPLTGAGNRRALEADLATLVEARRDNRESCGLAVLDIDHFKRVNDTHGHEAGDQVLIDLARIVRDNTRRDDRFYRLGGEEFVLLLPGTTPVGMEVALINLRLSIHKHLSGPDGPVTVSFGAASLTDGESWGDWLGRADGALFRAKRAGRDRIVMDPSDTGSVARIPVRRATDCNAGAL